MSLRDTIAGARSEASQSSSKGDTTTAAKKGASRGSAANAKPTREKAASVRTAGSSGKKTAASAFGAKKTKEQKEAEKAARRKEREEEDYRNQAFQLLLEQNPEYKRTDRIWWICATVASMPGLLFILAISLIAGKGILGILLGIGFVSTLISLIVTFVFPVENGDYSSTRGIVSIAALVIAYLFILASFIFDWVKRRPVRKELEAKMQGMSNKKIAQLFAKEREAEAERAAAKEEAKAAKKAAKK